MIEIWNRKKNNKMESRKHQYGPTYFFFCLSKEQEKNIYMMMQITGMDNGQMDILKLKTKNSSIKQQQKEFSFYISISKFKSSIKWKIGEGKKNFFVFQNKTTNLMYCQMCKKL